MSIISHCLAALLFTAMWTSALWAADDDMVIELKADVSIISRLYSLEDIASIYTKNPADKKQLAITLLAKTLLAKAMGRTPRPGQLAQLTRFEISSRLERMQPGISRKMRWQGPSVVRIRGTGIAYKAAPWEREAEKVLRNWLRARYAAIDDIEINVARVGESHSLVVPRGEINIAVRLSAAARVRKRMRVWVDVNVDGSAFQTLPVWFAVALVTPVRVANKPLAKHHSLSTADWTLERRDIAGLDAKSLSREMPDNHWLVRAIPAGQVLTADAIEVRPPVREGEEITVVTRHGRVSVAIKGVALSDGHLLARIEVENPSSGKSYHATVVGESLAQVQ